MIVTDQICVFVTNLEDLVDFPIARQMIPTDERISHIKERPYFAIDFEDQLSITIFHCFNQNLEFLSSLVGGKVYTVPAHPSRRLL